MDEGISSIVEVEECEDVTVESKNELASALEECVENELASALEECVENAVGDGIESRLKMLTQVRDRLAVELKGELVTDFPIKECKHANYMGFCNTNSGQWVELTQERKVAKITKVNWISVRLVTEEEPTRNLPTSSIIATLLHELAHAITPTYLVRGVLQEYAKATKSSRKWRYESHGSEFYSNFGRILSIAEKLGIFVLKGTNKFSARSLARFDAIDLGSPIKIDASTPFLEGNELADSKNPSAQVRVTVKLQKGKQSLSKLIVVPSTGEGTVMERILKESIKKLNCKGSYKLTSVGGTIIGKDEVPPADDSVFFLIKDK